MGISVAVDFPLWSFYISHRMILSESSQKPQSNWLAKIQKCKDRIEPSHCAIWAPVATGTVPLALVCISHLSTDWRPPWSQNVATSRDKRLLLRLQEVSEVSLDQPLAVKRSHARIGLWLGFVRITGKGVESSPGSNAIQFKRGIVPGVEVKHWIKVGFC